MPALLTAVYFVCAELSVVGAWNRRARLLSRRLDWAELTGRPLPPPHDDQQADEDQRRGQDRQFDGARPAVGRKQPQP